MAAKKVPQIQADYKPGSVKAAWDNHFAAFGAQDVTRIMQDYTEKSVLKAFDHTTGTLLTAKGLAQIAQFFTDLFNTLSDTSALAAPVIRTMEGTKTVDGSVYLIWSCASSGITSALDTFIHGADHRIVRQNIAFTSDPDFVPKKTTVATSKCQRSKCTAAHVCMHARADTTELGFMFACISPYIHTYMHTYIHTYIHACMHTYCILAEGQNGSTTCICWPITAASTITTYAPPKSVAQAWKNHEDAVFSANLAKTLRDYTEVGS